MRYLVFMAIVFGVYFWAIQNIGDRYVEKREIELPAPPDQSITDLHGGKFPLTRIQKKEKGEPQPTVRVVEY